MITLASWMAVVSDWTEQHAGLGGWLGAIGSIIAIFLAWWLARWEYRRDHKAEVDRRKSQLNMFVQVIEDYEAWIRPYFDDLDARSTFAIDPRRFDANDPRCHAMRDLAHIPVTLWPSVEAYLAFKKYWHASISVRSIGDDSGEKKSARISAVLRATEEAIVSLKAALARN